MKVELTIELAVGPDKMTGAQMGLDDLVGMLELEIEGWKFDRKRIKKVSVVD